MKQREQSASFVLPHINISLDQIALIISDHGFLSDRERQQPLYLFHDILNRYMILSR